MNKASGQKRKPSRSIITVEDARAAAQEAPKRWFGSNLMINQNDRHLHEKVLRNFVILPPDRSQKMKSEIDKELAIHRSCLLQKLATRLRQHQDLFGLENQIESVEDDINRLANERSQLLREKHALTGQIESTSERAGIHEATIQELGGMQRAFDYVHSGEKASLLKTCTLEDVRGFVGLNSFDDVARRSYDDLFATVYTLQALQWDLNREFPDKAQLPTSRDNLTSKGLVDVVAGLMKLENPAATTTDTKKQVEAPLVDPPSVTTTVADNEAVPLPVDTDKVGPPAAAPAAAISGVSSNAGAFVAEDEEEARLMRELLFEHRAKKRRLTQS